MVSTDVVIVAIVLIGVGIVLRWAEKYFAERLAETDAATKILELERRVDFLVAELQRAGVRYRELEATSRPGSPPAPAPLPSKPMLLICGPDPTLCEADRSAIRRTRITFTRLINATRQQVEDELDRRRADQSLYPWIHITAHASSDGVLLADGIASPHFWNEALIGCQVVFLAACKSAAVADALAGLVTVVYVLEDIENMDASAFTYAFWRWMKEHNDPVRAYRMAVTDVPQVAEYTDIRRG